MRSSVLLHVRYTSKQTGSVTTVYAISLAWPKDDQLLLAAASSTPQTKVTMLGSKASLKWKSHGTGGGIVVDVSTIPFSMMPCDWAWVFKLEYVNSS